MFNFPGFFGASLCAQGSLLCLHWQFTIVCNFSFRGQAVGYSLHRHQVCRWHTDIQAKHPYHHCHEDQPLAAQELKESHGLIQLDLQLTLWGQRKGTKLSFLRLVRKGNTHTPLWSLCYLLSLVLVSFLTSIQMYPFCLS